VNGSLVDTNVIIKMLHNDAEAIGLLQKAGKLYTSVVVKGELFYGAAKSARQEANRELFRNTLSKFEILPIDDDVAVSYALIKSKLEKKGKQIPENDVWIAATAHVCGLPVISFDKHFSYVDQIRLIS
jgi:predicted nucleic acid-binding protein